MKRTVEITIDIPIARKMLVVAGYWKEINAMTDDEVLEKVLEQVVCYGVQYEVKE